MTKTKNTTTANKKVDVPEEMRLAILAQLTDYKIAPVSDEELTKEINYVLAANGLFKVTKKPVAVYTEIVQELDLKLPGLPELEEGFRLRIPKIPGKYAIQLLSWYRDVYTKDGTECSVLFFWNHRDIEIPETREDGQPLKGVTVDGRLVIYAPIQENSPGLSDFKDDDQVQWFRQNMALLLESHSHNSMGAFFSGIDDANENMNQFYHVWGRVDTEMPEYVLRYVNGNTRKPVKLSDIFDMPQMEVRTKTTTRIDAKITGDLDLIAASNLEGSNEEVEEEVEFIEYRGPWPMVEYPANWMPQHTKERPVARSWGAGKKWDPVLKRYVQDPASAYEYPAYEQGSWAGYVDDFEDQYAGANVGKGHAADGAASTDSEGVMTYSLVFADNMDDTGAARQSIMSCLYSIRDADDDHILRSLLSKRLP